jgi:hypothetical protein
MEAPSGPGWEGVVRTAAHPFRIESDPFTRWVPPRIGFALHAWHELSRMATRSGLSCIAARFDHESWTRSGRRQLVEPVLAATSPIHVDPRNQHAARAVGALDPRSCSDYVGDQGQARSSERAEPGGLPGRLEDVLLEIAHAKLLGEDPGIALVALRSAALRDPGDHELVHVGTQRLVAPGALQGPSMTRCSCPGIIRTASTKA